MNVRQMILKTVEYILISGIQINTMEEKNKKIKNWVCPQALHRPKQINCQEVGQPN